MVDQQDQNSGFGKGIVQVDLARAFFGKACGELLDERLDDRDALAIGVSEPLHDFERRAFPQIVDIGLEGETKAGDAPFRVRVDQ